MVPLNGSGETTHSAMWLRKGIGIVQRSTGIHSRVNEQLSSVYEASRYHFMACRNDAVEETFFYCKEGCLSGCSGSSGTLRLLPIHAKARGDEAQNSSPLSHGMPASGGATQSTSR